MRAWSDVCRDSNKSVLELSRVLKTAQGELWTNTADLKDHSEPQLEQEIGVYDYIIPLGKGHIDALLVVRVSGKLSGADTQIPSSATALLRFQRDVTSYNP